MFLFDDIQIIWPIITAIKVKIYCFIKLFLENLIITVLAVKLAVFFFNCLLATAYFRLFHSFVTFILCEA